MRFEKGTAPLIYGKFLPFLSFNVLPYFQLKKKTVFLFNFCFFFSNRVRKSSSLPLTPCKNFRWKVTSISFPFLGIFSRGKSPPPQETPPPPAKESVYCQIKFLSSPRSPVTIGGGGLGIPKGIFMGPFSYADGYLKVLIGCL